jgi:hypothetical protein
MNTPTQSWIPPRNGLIAWSLYHLAAWTILLFFPHLVWMKNHDWITTTYGLRRGASEQALWLHHLWRPVEFLLTQAAILAPLLLVSIMGMIGLLAALFAFGIALYFTAKRLLGIEIDFTTLVILISGLGGLILVAIALVGEYVARIYDEVKNRPSYIVKSSSMSESHD